MKQHVARSRKLVAASDTSFDESLPAEASPLEQVAAQFKIELDANDKKLVAIDQEINDDQQINAAAEKPAVKGAKSKNLALSLRQQHASANEAQISLHAVVESLRNELERMLTTEQIEQQIGARKKRLGFAHRTRSRRVKRERVDDQRSARLPPRKRSPCSRSQIKDADKEYHGIEAVLSRTEGLHSKRAAAAALVEELTRQTEREMLEAKRSIDYVLFEESRDKQLGLVLGRSTIACCAG